MKRFIVAALAVLGLCAAIPSVSVHAQDKAMGKTMSASGTVKSVSGAMMVVTGGGKDWTFTLDNTTKFTGKGLGTKAKQGPVMATDAVHEGDMVDRVPRYGRDDARRQRSHHQLQAEEIASQSARLRNRCRLSGDGDERGPLCAGIRRHEQLDLTAAGAARRRQLDRGRVGRNGRPGRQASGRRGVDVDDIDRGLGGQDGCLEIRRPQHALTRRCR